MQLKAGDLFSHYEILERVGIGGMGAVYKARDLRLKRIVALKLLLGDAYRYPRHLSRFLREAESAAALNHPRIAHVYEADQEQGVPFLAMEFVPGGSLRDQVDRGAIPPERTLRWATEIAEALAAAHRRGIVHRDLKPGNVLLDADGHVKLCDFGLARQLTPEQDDPGVTGRLTAEGIVVGTASYMSPEQSRGEEVGPASDVFSFGSLLYELAAGRPPFERRTLVETLNAVMNEEAPPILEPPVAGLDGIIERCLEKDVERRPSAESLLQDLESMARRRLSASESPTVMDAPSLRRRKKRRARWPVAAAVAGLVASAACFGWWLSRRPPGPPRDTVVIGSIENQTGDEALEGTLAAALHMSLEQSRQLAVLSPVRVEQALRRMRKSGAEKLDEALGREVSLREGARALVTGTATRLGDQFVLTLRIVDPESGGTLRTLSERAAARDEILAAVDRLAARLRRELGESLSSIARSQRRFDEVTTSSLDSLKHFTEGNRLWRSGRRDEARALFERAIELDPDFARAYASLANTYAAYSIDLVKAERYFQEALKRLDRVTERERLEIQALYHGAMDRDREAIGFYRMLIDAYPRVEWYRHNLGRQLQDLRQWDEAIRAYEEVLRLDPSSASALINIATCYGLMGEREKALPYYERAFTVEPDWKTDTILNHEYAWTLVQSGREAAAREVVREMLGKDEGARARGHRSLGLLALYRGRFAEGRRELEEAARLHQLGGSHDSSARDQYYLAEALLLVGGPDPGAALARARSLLARAGHPAWLVLRLAALYARAGEPQAAEELLKMGRAKAAEHSAGSETDLLRAEGELLLARGAFDEAIEKLRLATASQSWILTDSSLALALARAGRAPEAIALYQKIVENPPPAWEGQVAWALAHWNLANLYEQEGKLGEARAAYSKLVEIWHDGDPGLGPLEEAGQALRRLAPGSESPTND
jgi:tetratricopeptide (TPR) repeat protein/tRNA A-37 threonylcarbamoyl transferase component Bud32